MYSEETIQSVSYTHLDVYKRQAQWEKSVTYYLFDSTDINNELDKIEDNKITKGETLPAADEIFKDYITDVDSFTDGWYKSGDWGPSYTEKTPVTTADDLSLIHI